MKTSDMLNLAMLAALGIGAFWLFNKFKTGKFDPRSRENVLYKATGEIGLKLADRFPSSAELAVAKMLAVPPRATPGSGYLVPSSAYSPATGAPLTPAQMSTFDLFNLQYGGGVSGLGSNGRWLS